MLFSKWVIFQKNGPMVILCLFTKKASKHESENYRGITLLTVFGKLFSRVLNNRLDNWAEEYNVYIQAQAGFRARLSTVDNIFVLHGVVKYCLS